MLASGSHFWEYKEDYFVKDSEKVISNDYFTNVIGNYPIEALRG